MNQNSESDLSPAYRDLTTDAMLLSNTNETFDFRNTTTENSLSTYRPNSSENSKKEKEKFNYQLKLNEPVIRNKINKSF